MNNNSSLPVAVIGAGPVGLAAAAHLLSRGLTPVVLEAGSGAAQHLRHYAHVRLFSSWRYNIDKASSALLASHGWLPPDLEELPTAGDVVEKYLEPLAAALHPHVLYNARVTAISRAGFDKVKTAGREHSPFVLRYQSPAGHTAELLARAVIDASGTWSTPNPLGANGLPAPGEPENQDRIFYGIPDVDGALRSRYAGRRTLVVGSGHSAANSLLALAALAAEHPSTEVLWALRGSDTSRVFGGGSADALPARGQLGADLRRLRDSGALTLLTGFFLSRIERDGDTLTISARNHRLEQIHEIVCATGQRPDYAMSSELRLQLDPWLESSAALGPLIDPNVHSCGTVRPHGHRELAHPEPGFYTAGVKSYGRAPTFLLATGFEQVRSIAAALAGDLAAADDVQLDLPQTGVCSISPAPAGQTAKACCR